MIWTRLMAGVASVSLFAGLTALGQVSAANSGTTVPGTGEGACTEERVGGAITYGSPAGAVSLDPNVALGSNAPTQGFELSAIYDTFFVLNQETGEYEPNVAESLTPNDDLTEWTMVLRAGVTFGNGDPLDADALISSVERTMQSAAPGLAGRQLIDLLEELTPVDDLTVTFVLKTPFPEFAELMQIRPFFVVNTNVVAEKGEEAFSSDPSGAGVGPYEVERAVFGEEIVLTAKDDYWGGPVCIQTVRVITTSDPRLAVESLAAGEVDLTVSATPTYVQQLQEDGAPGIAVAGSGVDILLLNAAESAPTADVNVRRAVAAAIDSQVINQRAFQGALPESGNALVGENSLYYSPGLSGPPYDPELAAELVATAKADGWDGKIRVLGRAHQQEELIAIQAMLQAAGMDATTEAVESSELNRRVTANNDFDIALYQLANGVGAVAAGLSQFQTGAARNQNSFSDPAFDAAHDALAIAYDASDRQAAMVAIQDVWNDVVPGVVTTYRNSYITWDSSVHGIRTTGWDFPLLIDAYVD